MAIQTKVTCDVCEKECTPENGVGHFQGKIAQIVMEKETLETQKQRYQFAEDFCPECSEVVLNFIVSFKNDVKTRGGNK